MNLRLDDNDSMPRTKELLCRSIGLLKGDGDLPVGHAYAIAAEDLFGLVLVNLQCALREPVARTKAIVADARYPEPDAGQLRLGGGRGESSLAFPLC